jgi:tripeptide aminopeptidase
VSFDAPLDAGQLLADLCAIPSSSFDERDCGEFVFNLLFDLGFVPVRDGAGGRIGGTEDNIHVLIPSADGRTSGGVLLAAHLDTVPVEGVPSAQCVDGFWSNSGPGVLGIDNKAAVAALLCAAARWATSAPVEPVALVFTVAEETGLAGALAIDATRLTAEAAFVFDHPTPIGTVVTESPVHTSIRASFTGVPAHAGIRPEAGRSAIAAAARAVAEFPSGRISPTATGNVGRIAGGNAVNVVAADCWFEAELRGTDLSEHGELLASIGGLVNRAAEAHGCGADVKLKRSFSGYSHSEDHIALRVGEAALANLRITPERISSAGGSDANAFEAFGVASLNLGDGSSATHTSDEQISDQDLRILCELAVSLPAALSALR